ncbi:MAG: beta-propeller domain-containing protein [Candidatus Bilamarchaeum sp.]
MKKYSIVLGLFVVAIMFGCITPTNPLTNSTQNHSVNLASFSSCSELSSAFANSTSPGYGFDKVVATTLGGNMMPTVAAAESGRYSATNTQVGGVDESDLVKTHGKYIYLISNQNVLIIDSNPQNPKVLSNISVPGSPLEMFIDNNRLIIFSTNSVRSLREFDDYILPDYRSFVAVSIYDTANKSNPHKIKSAELEGNFVSARKIGSQVYFISQKYIYRDEGGEGILPMYKENEGSLKAVSGCSDVVYPRPLKDPNSILTIASFDVKSNTPDLKKNVFAFSGQTVYASAKNLYLSESSWGEDITKLHKFALENGDVSYIATGNVSGHLLNQFSMDEYQGNFRVATTSGHVGRGQFDSSNNIYVLDQNMKQIGELEDLAPGERIYSARFMGQKVYLVTFKKVDPLFVIDLSDPASPNVLGKLKIPGYSDYLHPIDENHLIGIGKDTIEAQEGDFAWYQGIKMALFDVSDVEHPKELHKVIIGDRGTDSPVLNNHKAFLYDKETGLLSFPVLLAERSGREYQPYEQGDFTFQGAYVYSLSIEDGFDLRGRITHYNNNAGFKKAGYYYQDYGYDVIRVLYIGDYLYTLSENTVAINSLDDLGRVSQVKLN